MFLVPNIDQMYKEMKKIPSISQQASTLTFVRYQWKLTSDKQILYYGCPTGQVKKSEIPKHAVTTDKSISTGIKYWVCCIKEPCLISNLSIIYFD